MMNLHQRFIFVKIVKMQTLFFVKEKKCMYFWKQMPLNHGSKVDVGDVYI